VRFFTLQGGLLFPLSLFTALCPQAIRLTRPFLADSESDGVSFTIESTKPLLLPLMLRLIPLLDFLIIASPINSTNHNVHYDLVLVPFQSAHACVPGYLFSTFVYPRSETKGFHL